MIRVLFVLVYDRPPASVNSKTPLSRPWTKKAGKAKSTWHKSRRTVTGCLSGRTPADFPVFKILIPKKKIRQHPINCRVRPSTPGKQVWQKGFGEGPPLPYVPGCSCFPSCTSVRHSRSVQLEIFFILTFRKYNRKHFFIFVISPFFPLPLSFRVL